MAKIIKHQFFFPHPPETVWEYLTKSELMAQWLMKNDFQPIVGSIFNSGQIPSQPGFRRHLLLQGIRDCSL
jgi:uncharacterized protein YndB with AHSA1/START domain